MFRLVGIRLAPGVNDTDDLICGHGRSALGEMAEADGKVHGVVGPRSACPEFETGMADRMGIDLGDPA